MSAPRRVLVVLPRPLGDAVMAEPALRAVRATWPKAWIAWGGTRSGLEALAGLSTRDAVLPLGAAVGRRWRTRRRVVAQVRALQFDTALLLPNSVSSAFEAWLARIPRRVGTGLSFLRRRLVTEVVQVPLDARGKLAPRSMVDHYMDLAVAGGATRTPSRPRLVVEPFDRERAAIWLASVEHDRPLLGVQPGAAFGPSKRLPPPVLASAVKRLAQEDGWKPLVLVGPGEESLGAALVEAIGPDALATHARPPDVGLLKGLLARLGALVSADAGPRHMAEALGVPVVVFMGPTDPRWGGGGEARVVRREDLQCLGCHRRTCPLHHHACLAELDPMLLVEAVRAATRARPGGR